MPKTPSSFFARFWPLLLLAALSVVFLGDVWFGGRMLALRDFFVGDAPAHALFGKFLREGNFSLWTSASQCGLPTAAQPYSGTFYPPNWIFVFPNLEWVIRIWWTFHLAVAAISCFALARHWRLSIAPALFAGIAFAFSTYVVTWMEFAHGFCCLVWGPLVLLYISRIIDTTAELCGGMALSSTPGKPFPAIQVLAGNGAPIIALAFVVALQVLGSGEYFYYTGLIAGSYGVARWIWLRNWRACATSMVLIGLGVLLGVALAMPQFILTLELMRYSDRIGEVDSLANIASAHPRYWLTLLLPFLYGRPGYPDAFWGPSIYELAVGHCYVGLLPLIGSVFAFGWLKKRKTRGDDDQRPFLVWFFCGLILTGLLMAAGKFTPIYGLMHHWLPGLGHLRFPTKFFLFLVYALPILGALGFQSLLEPADKADAARRGQLWRVAAGLFGVVLLGFVICLMSDTFLPWLMAKPENLKPTQVDAAFGDYCWAAAFTAAGLIFFGLLAYGKRARWIEGAVVLTAFLNLWIISRQTQPTIPSGVYTSVPGSYSHFSKDQIGRAHV